MLSQEACIPVLAQSIIFSVLSVRRQNIVEVFASLDSYMAVLLLSRAQRIRPQAPFYICVDGDPPAQTREEGLDIRLPSHAATQSAVLAGHQHSAPASKSRVSLFSGEAEARVVLQCSMQTSMHHFLRRWHIHFSFLFLGF